MRHPNDGGGPAEDVFGGEFSARTLAHEYGGLAYAVHQDDTVYFSNFADQRLYRAGEQTRTNPSRSSAEPPSERSVRYAAPVLTPDGLHIIAVRERHPEPGPSRRGGERPRCATDGRFAGTDGARRRTRFLRPASALAGRVEGRLGVLGPSDHALGRDGSPGSRTSTPDMWRRDAPAALREGSDESVITAEVQPGRHPVLRLGPDRLVESLSVARAEERRAAVSPWRRSLGGPQWQFGMSQYAIRPDGAILSVFKRTGPPAAAGWASSSAGSPRDPSV